MHHLKRRMFKKLFLLITLFFTQVNCLKIDRVILSTDNHPSYIEFWPIVAKAWKELIGIKPTLALIADSSIRVDETLGDIIRFEPIPNIPTSLQAQVIRLLLPAYFENEVCIISDIDMIPLNKEYFFESIKEINEDSFVVYRDAYYAGTFKYPMCYNAAKGKVYKEVFKINDIKEIPEIIKKWHSYNLGWNTDEILLYKYLNGWKDFKKRCVTLGHIPDRRIDRLNWNYNFKEIRNYIDAHCLRPYSTYKYEIDKLIDTVYALNSNTQEKADCVIYSFDRPLQLYALLESIEKYISSLGEVQIIYRVSNEAFDSAYEQIVVRFKNYKFHKQGKNPHADFKNLMMNCAFNSPNDYIVFAVDDIIVKDQINISECIKALKNSGAYGFYLRLGKNITKSYMAKLQTPIPNNQNVCEDIHIFTFKDGTGDWAYPNSNDMTIYKKTDIKSDLEKINFTIPCEGPWAVMAKLERTGLFFENSKILNIPMNLVHETAIAYKNQNMQLFTTNQLLEIFNLGLKIDIDQFYKINNNSPHVEIVPEFIKRK